MTEGHVYRIKLMPMRRNVFEGVLEEKGVHLWFAVCLGLTGLMYLATAVLLRARILPP